MGDYHWVDLKKWTKGFGSVGMGYKSRSRHGPGCLRKVEVAIGTFGASAVSVALETDAGFENMSIAEVVVEVGHCKYYHMDIHLLGRRLEWVDMTASKGLSSKADKC